MENEKQGKKENRKGFFSRIIDKLDKRLAEKAKRSSCCNSSDKDKGKSCC